MNENINCISKNSDSFYLVSLEKEDRKCGELSKDFLKQIGEHLEANYADYSKVIFNKNIESYWKIERR